MFMRLSSQIRQIVIPKKKKKKKNVTKYSLSRWLDATPLKRLAWKLVQQSCPCVQFLQPNPTQPTKRLTQPNDTHRKVNTLDPQNNPTHNPIELHTANNKPSGTKKTT